MRMRITILSENTVGERLDAIAEQGLSMFIETNAGNYLFDTGRGHTIIHNTLFFKKDLSSIKGIILSHGHHDHTGGLPRVLQMKGEVDVFAHPHIMLERFRIRDNGEKNYTGIPFKREYLEGLGAKFHFEREFCKITENMYLSGEIPRVTSFEEGDLKGRFAIIDGKECMDYVLDDLSLIIDLPEGLIVLLGCAHSGIINILNHCIKKTQKDKFIAVLGGTHLGYSGKMQLEETIEALRGFNIEKIGASHCTGMEPAARLYQEFGDRVLFFCVGSHFEI